MAKMEVIQDTSTLDPNKKIYRCTVCQKLFNWKDGESGCYGSYKQMEEDRSKLIYYCSDDCKSQVNIEVSYKSEIEILKEETEEEVTFIYKYKKPKREAYRLSINIDSGEKTLKVKEILCKCGKKIVSDSEIKIKALDNLTLNCPCGEIALLV
jgi:hypothetical protein